MRTETVTCDACRRDLLRRPCLLLIGRPAEGAFHFCGVACLRRWLEAGPQSGVTRSTADLISDLHRAATGQTPRPKE